MRSEDNEETVEREAVPFVRIWLCGPLTIEWRDPVSGQLRSHSAGDVTPKDWSVALSLLALLLCQPHRRAPRDWIMEQFWPESSTSTASHRLETIHSSLSRLLPVQANGESLFHSIGRKKASGVLYQLEPYPKLWIDRDALLWNVEQAARMERFGDDPFPYWERAFELGKRGSFLLDEPYAEWAEEPRRQVEGAYRQCVHALARLYQEQHGDVGKEEALHLLRTYWLTHQTDEDALRPLMELLGEQERYQEAEEYYQAFLLALMKEGHEQQPDGRTQDIHTYLHTKQYQRLRHYRSSSLPATFLSVETPSLSFHRLSLLTEEHRHGIIEAPPGTEDPSFATNAFSEKDDMEKTRRDVLHFLSMAGIVLAFPFPIGAVEEGTFSTLRCNTTVVNDLALINRSLWNLYVATPVKALVLESALGHFKTLISLLKAPQGVHHHQRLTELTSEISQLIGEIFFDRNDHDMARLCYTFAAMTAREADSYDLWACALVRHAFLPLYHERYNEALVFIQEAQKLSVQGNTVLPTRYWAAAVEAEIQAGLLNSTACQKALDHAEGVQEIKEQTIPWVRFHQSRLPALRGACYVRLGKMQEAESVLHEALHAFPQSDRKRGMVLLDLAVAAIQRGEAEEAISYITEVKHILAISSSRFLQQELQRLPQRIASIDHPAIVQTIWNAMNPRT